MTVSVDKTLSRLRNTRDLRAEVVSLAAELVGTRTPGRLTIRDSAISTSTVRGEWDRLLRALDPGSLHDSSRAGLRARAHRAAVGT